ncbi:MAG: hypothetical protein ACLFTI_04570 [Anaerolineales bacterium]
MTTWVVTPGGRPRPELLAFLKSIPDLELLDAPMIATELDGSRPIDLLIFDAHAPHFDNWAELRNIKARAPQACCLTLVSAPRQMALAQAAGADHVLLAGFSTPEFFKMLRNLP